MTNITFKNGLPLLLQPYPGSEVGLVAANSGCCCPPTPPEPSCFCGHFCSYFIELVEPSEIAVKTPIYLCLVNRAEAVASINNFIFELPELLIPRSFGSGATGGVFGQEMVVRVGHGGEGNFLVFDDTMVTNVEVGLSVGFEVTCGWNPETQSPSYNARLSILCTLYIGDFVYSHGSSAKQFEGTFEIPSECVVSEEKECFPYRYGEQAQSRSRIITPVTVTLSGDGTSSLGALTQTPYLFRPSPGPGNVDAQELVDAILAASNWTFRITARETCASGCCCEENTPITDVETSEECAVSLVAKPEELRDIDTITVVVEWDELIGECNSGNDFNFGVLEVGIDPTFACVQPGPFTIQADLRGMNLTGNLTASNSCNLWQFSGVLQLYFEGVGPFGGRPQSGINLDIFVSECHDGYVSPIPAPGTDPSWCPNDYEEPVVTLVIAP